MDLEQALAYALVATQAVRLPSSIPALLNFTYSLVTL